MNKLRTLYKVLPFKQIPQFSVAAVSFDACAVDPARPKRNRSVRLPINANADLRTSAAEFHTRTHPPSYDCGRLLEPSGLLLAGERQPSTPMVTYHQVERGGVMTKETVLQTKEG